MQAASRLAHQRSTPTLFVASFAVLVLAGAMNTSLDVAAQPVLASSFAAAGVVGLAMVARSLDRTTLASITACLWAAFVVVALAHLASGHATDAVGSLDLALVDTGTLVALARGVTWATLICAVATTTFLAIRAIAARHGAESPEERVLDTDLDL